MTGIQTTLATLAAGLVLALGCAGSASAGPAPIRNWDTGSSATIAQPEPLADGQVVFGATPTLLDTASDFDFEYALVLQTPQLRTGQLGRGHLFLMRRPINDVQAGRRWERVGGQIDELDPGEDGHTEDAGVQTARLSCNARSYEPNCWVAYTVQGRLTLARPVNTEGRFSWERVRLAVAGDRVGRLAIWGWAEWGHVGWAQADHDSPTGSAIRLADVIWAPGRDLEVKQVVSFGPGGRLQLTHGALMVDDEREIRVYNAYDSVSVGAPSLRLRFERAQPTGRVLLSPSPGIGNYLVVEPAPGGALVHQFDVYAGEEVGCYRLTNPDWLPAGAVPMALTASDDRGWLVVGTPGAPGRHALVEITAERDRTLGARVYQIPNLPAPAGYDPGNLPIVVPEVIGAINATALVGPPTVDLLTTANLIPTMNHTDHQQPIGHTALLAERVVTPRGSGMSGQR